MKEQFVPYELALKLKKLGFDEECFGAWKDNKKTPMKGYFENQIISSLDNAILAPLWQQAFDWFDTFNMYSEINRIPIGSDEWEYGFTIDYLPVEGKNFKRRSGCFKTFYSFTENGSTYMGAWKACLEKLIEILTVKKFLMMSIKMTDIELDLIRKWRIFQNKIEQFENTANIQLFEEIFSSHSEANRLIENFKYECRGSFLKFESYLDSHQKNLLLTFICQKYE